MTVIEVEGTNTEPLLIDSLMILPGARGFIQLSCSDIDVKIGQRYSVVVCLSCPPFIRGAPHLSVGQSQPACG